MGDPTLDLRNGNGAIESNDNWQESPEAGAIQASGFAPPDARESAIRRTLDPGSYVAIAAGVNNSTGVARLEIIDLAPNSGSQVGSLATQDPRQSSQDVVLGFTISGPANQRVLVEGIGPSLAGQGVPNPLQDPTLQLQDSNGTTLAFNNNWKDTQQAEIEAASIPPSDDRESAIVGTLAPGSYTATLSGVCNTTGITRVEIFSIQTGGAVTTIPSSSRPTCGPSPTPTPTAVPTATPSATATSTATPTATIAPTATPTATVAPTATPTPTPVIIPTATPTPAATATPGPTATATPAPVPNVPPTVVLTTIDNGGTTPPDGSKIPAGQTINLSATASDDHAVASVAFVVDGGVITRVTTVPYNTSITLLASGDHTLMARATDDQGASTDSNVITVTILPAGGIAYTFTGGVDNSWDNPANWSPQGVPGPADLAQLTGGVTVDAGAADIAVASLTVNGNSSLAGSGKVTASNRLTFTGGVFNGVHIVVPAGAQLLISGDDGKALIGVTIDNNADTECTGKGVLSSDGATVFNNNAVFVIRSLTTGSGDVSAVVQLSQFNNAGVVRIRGTLNTATFTQSSGQLDLQAYLDNGDVGPLSLAVIEGHPILLKRGTLTGSGLTVGELVNDGGAILPGHSAGVIKVQGNYTQGPDASLVLEIGGTEVGQYDQLLVSGTAKLDGNLTVRTINNFTPDAATKFTPLQFSNVDGEFAATSSNTDVAVSPTGVEVKVTGPNPPPPQAQNISTRLSVQGGENVLIGGFIITGPTGTTKHIAVRGIGPSLNSLGIADALADPLLELHESDGSVVTNDNWQDAANAGDVPDVLVPKDAHESVIVSDLSAGGYTAIVKGANGETGVGLAEVYDLDQPSYTNLANISTRGFVQTGDDVMIGGFIIGGTEPAKVLVRAIGASLANQGVQDPLADPMLEVHDSNGAVISNDDWRNTQETEIQATTIPPTDDRESAILGTLSPGNYTAIVRGKNQTSGVALVEVYMLQ